VSAAAVVLGDYARDEWLRVAPGLHAIGLLAIGDEMPLAAYCAAYSRWRLAEEALTRMAAHDPIAHGLLIKTAEGNARTNPLVRIARDAANAMTSVASHFGMMPVARSRIAAGVGVPTPSGSRAAEFAVIHNAPRI
jgi:P27 family predicted phage terminase small subunit